MFLDGQLDLSRNTGNSSANVTQDAYVDLPNGIIQAAARSGTSGALSLEFWFTVTTTRTWQRLGDFAGPDVNGGGEDVINNNAVDFLFVTPSSGRNNRGLEMVSQARGMAESMLGLNGPPPGPVLPINVEHHVVAVYDKTNEMNGNQGGTMSLYLNGVAIVPGQPDVTGSGEIDPELDLNNLNDEDNWLGRSQWNDPLFTGKYNEFRIYDHALSAAEMTASFAAGPTPVPEPSLVFSAVTCAVAFRALAGRSRAATRRQTEVRPPT